MERLPERQRDAAVAVPAQLDHLALVGEQLQRRGSAPRRSRWRARRGRSRPRRRRVRRTRRRARRRRPPRAGSTSTSWTRTPGMRASSAATQQPTIPPPTTAIRSPTSGAASHRALTAVSTVPASTARAAGTASGTTVTAPAGTTYRVRCGARQNTVRPTSPAGPVLHLADVEVAVLDGRRELADLERRPHPGVLARGHAAAEDEGLGAAADRREPGPHHDVVRPGGGQVDGADLALAGGTQPEGARACDARTFPPLSNEPARQRARASHRVRLPRRPRPGSTASSPPPWPCSSLCSPCCRCRSASACSAGWPGPRTRSGCARCSAEPPGGPVPPRSARPTSSRWPGPRSSAA